VRKKKPPTFYFPPSHFLGGGPRKRMNEGRKRKEGISLLSKPASPSPKKRVKKGEKKGKRTSWFLITYLNT